MTRLKQPHRSGSRAAGGRASRQAPPEPSEEPTILGFPAEVDTASTEIPVAAGVAEAPGDGDAPDVPAQQEALTVLKRPDAVAAGTLVLAGVAANVSLLVSWSPGEEPTGLSLVQRGGAALDSGLTETVRGDVWAPLVIVLSGGLLVLLGFLLLVPARTHRLVGLLALVVSLAATAAVLFVVSDVDWQTDRFGPGTWCAVAVPVLGLVGSLKAMLTAPRVTLAPSGSTASSEVAA
jgi:hypothetical protein